MERSNFLRGVFKFKAPRYGIKKDRKRRAVAALAVLFLLVAVWCGVMLLSAQAQYGASDDYYSKIRAGVSPRITDDKTQKVTMTEEDFLAVGKDVVGWITLPGTQIDYPVARCENNSYYCYHLPDGTYNVCGTIFMDFTKSSGLINKNTILYGHHMKNGSMFQNITYYKDSSFYDSHKTAYYYTAHGDYEIQIAYGFIISSEKWKQSAYSKDENAAELLKYAKENTTFDSGVEITADDRIMTFSTCSYEFGNANYMLIGKVVPIYE